jgi:Holliday junction resolvase RusA-like endonuclease
LSQGLEIPKATKPDLDNLGKGVLDALQGIVFENDSQIWEYKSIRKVYGSRFGIELEIEQTETWWTKLTKVVKNGLGSKVS